MLIEVCDSFDHGYLNVEATDIVARAHVERHLYGCKVDREFINYSGISERLSPRGIHGQQGRPALARQQVTCAARHLTYLRALTFDQDGRPAKASILGELTAWGDALEEGEASDRFSTGEVRLWPQEEPFLRWLAPPVRWDGVGRTG